MLLLIVFWFALAVVFLGMIGAVAERGGQITWPTFLLVVIAFLAAVVDRASWL